MTSPVSPEVQAGQSLPIVCGYLTCIGDERDGHMFFVSVEESSGGIALIRGDEVISPWLRATCSCGWRAENVDRFTIEENAHHLWLTTHAARQPNPRGTNEPPVCEWCTWRHDPTDRECP